MIACYGLRTYGRYITHSSTYPIEVAAEEAMLDLETSGAVEEVIEETIVEPNATHAYVSGWRAVSQHNGISRITPSPSP